MEGFEGSPGQGSLECFEIILLWQELGAPGSLWWHHVCCAMAKRIWFSTYKRKYKSFWYKDCICFKARSKRITPFFWSESVTLLLEMFAMVLGVVLFPPPAPTFVRLLSLGSTAQMQLHPTFISTFQCKRGQVSCEIVVLPACISVAGHRTHCRD